MSPSIAILIGAALATTGWLYTARRARTLSKKQHTINLMIQASFNKEFLEARNALAPYLKDCCFPEDVIKGENDELKARFRAILNHYEFVSAGIRNGDLDERLLKDSERSSCTMLYKCCENYIWNLRDSRDRLTLYEHLEWLYERWEKSPPGWFQLSWEKVFDAPVYGKRNGKK